MKTKPKKVTQALDSMIKSVLTMAEEINYEKILDDISKGRKYKPVPLAIIGKDIEIDGEIIKRGVYILRTDGLYDFMTIEKWGMREYGE